MRFRELWSDHQPALPTENGFDKSLKEDILAAYLEPFTRFESMERLHRAMHLTVKLETAWRLFKWSQDAVYDEPESVLYFTKAQVLQKIAKLLIWQDEQNGISR